MQCWFQAGLQADALINYGNSISVPNATLLLRTTGTTATIDMLSRIEVRSVPALAVSAQGPAMCHALSGLRPTRQSALAGLSSAACGVETSLLFARLRDEPEG